MGDLPATDRRHTPHGFTLIEVLGTLSVLLAIAVASTSMLGTVTGVGLAGKQADQARTDIARLATSFRADVRQAARTTVGHAGTSIDLAIGDQLIRYQFLADAPSVIRRRIDSGETKSIESFSLTQRCRPQFELQDRQVKLRLTAENARDPWIIEAVRP